MVTRIIKHTELDKRLDRLSKEPEQFTRLARDLVGELDAKSIDLEITDPQSWRCLLYTSPSPRDS